jgi:predicted phage-related endonuclease
MLSRRYYFQIQGQLFVTGRQWCDLVYWGPEDYFEERIEKDEEFWSDIQPRLKGFYFDHLLPEIINPKLAT